ncbi:SERTA domain-containing protein 3 [Marasmius sp. AFHP31]|nr:SERTA domain-containing protein 3 [Marasmius sp. AFHP31]
MIEWNGGTPNSEEEDDEEKSMEDQSIEGRLDKSAETEKERQEEGARMKRSHLTLGWVVQPLLDGLQQYTGYSIVFLAGEVKSVNDTKFTGYTLCSNPIGTTPFPLFNEEHSHNVGNTFSDWLKHIKGVMDLSQSLSQPSQEPPQSSSSPGTVPLSSSATASSQSNTLAQPNPPISTNNPSNPTVEGANTSQTVSQPKPKRCRRKHNGQATTKKAVGEGKEDGLDKGEGRVTCKKGRKKAATAEEDVSESDSNSDGSTDWSKADDCEGGGGDEASSEEEEHGVDINISDEAYKTLSYEERRRVNIAQNQEKLKGILKDISGVLPPTKTELAKRERGERRKKQKQAIAEDAGQRGTPRRSSRLTVHPPDHSQPITQLSASNTLPSNSCNPLHWPEVYTMALEYINNAEAFPKFEERLMTDVFDKRGVSYEYRLLKLLYEKLWMEDASVTTMWEAVESVRDAYLGGNPPTTVSPPLLDNEQSPALGNDVGRANSPSPDNHLPSPLFDNNDPSNLDTNPSPSVTTSSSPPPLNNNGPSNLDTSPSPSVSPPLDNEQSSTLGNDVGWVDSSLPDNHLPSPLFNNISLSNLDTNPSPPDIASPHNKHVRETLQPSSPIPSPSCDNHLSSTSGSTSSPSDEQVSDPVALPVTPVQAPDTPSKVALTPRANAIPILPDYLKHGQRDLQPKEYPSVVSKLQFPSNYLLHLQNVPNLKRKRPEEWDTMVMKWHDLESMWSSMGVPAQELDKESWPDFFGIWFWEGRTRALRSCTLVQRDMVESEWWTWWSAVNPTWRPRLGSRLVEREDLEGDWEVLERPGKEGIVLPLMALRWWFDILEEAHDHSPWMTALSSYYHTLCDLLCVARQSVDAQKPAQSTRQSKRVADTSPKPAPPVSRRYRK